MRSFALVAVSITASLAFILGCDGSRSVDPSTEFDGRPSAARGSVSEIAAPTGARAAAVTSIQINVDWQDNSSNETAFEVQRSSTGESGTYSVLATMAANSVAYEDLAVIAASQYCYRIRAVRVTGKKSAYSLFSNTSCATTPSQPLPPDMPSIPAAPSNVTAIPSSESAITIAWQDNSTDESGFMVSRVGFNPFATVGANTVTALSYGLSQGVQYCYQVQAYHSMLSNDGIVRTVYSTLSDTACAIIPLPSSPPEGSYAITVKPASSNVINVSPVWTGVSNPPALRIYRSLDAGSSWSQINPYQEYDGTLYDGHLMSEQQACYYVIAFNAAGDGPASNTACSAPPNAPTDLVANSVDAETLELRWTDNSSVEDGYQIITYVIQGSPDNAGTSEGEGGVMADVPANSTSARVPKLTASPYSSIAYFVIAKKDGGRSDTSNQVSATEAIP